MTTLSPTPLTMSTPATPPCPFSVLVPMPPAVEQATSVEPGGTTGPPEQRHKEPVGRDCAADGVVREPLVDDGVVHR